MPEKEDEYTIPDNYQELDEIAAPSPVEEHDSRLVSLEDERSRRGTASSSNRSSYRGSNRHLQDERPAGSEQVDGAEEDCTISDDYWDLSEIAIPPPIDSRHSGPHDDLESRLSEPRQGSRARQARTPRETYHESHEENLTKLADPAPLQRLPSRGTDEDSTVDPSPHSSGDVQDEKRPPPLHNKSSVHRKVSKFATEVYTVSYLILFSILGTLARLGLQALTFYPGAPVVTGVLWCNLAGSFIMGFLSEDQKLFHEDFENSRSHAKEHDAEKAGLDESHPALQPYFFAAQKQATSRAHSAVKKTIPLYIGLATGWANYASMVFRLSESNADFLPRFCGSFTSFSSFIRDAHLALSNALPVPVSHTSAATINTASTVHRNGGYSFMAICAVVILTVVLCIGALIAGAHLALALEPFTPHIPSLFARRIVDRTIVFMACVAWLGAIIMSIWPPDRPGGSVGQALWAQEFWRGDALFALIFAPVGCLLRFYASLHLNGKIQSFPLGTFVVNIFGTAMLGLFFDLQHVPLGGRVGCQVLQGLMDGFCGCLTTVSTWVAELKGLRIKHAYIYGVASVGTGVSLMVVIMGSLQWTRDFRPPLCSH